MRRITEKQERALGVKLFVKADRCASPKCATVRRPSRPGQHGERRQTKTDFGKQLMEKQKIQWYFGLTNRQMRRLFAHPSPMHIRQVLEHRLDQVVFQLGIAKSPRIARQLINHGHITVNGRRSSVSSHEMKVGDTVGIRSESRELALFEGLKERLKEYPLPAWLSWNQDTYTGTVVAPSTSVDSTFPFDITVVGQFYAR